MSDTSYTVLNVRELQKRVLIVEVQLPENLLKDKGYSALEVRKKAIEEGGLFDASIDWLNTTHRDNSYVLTGRLEFEADDVTTQAVIRALSK